MQSWHNLIDLINLILSRIIQLAGKIRGYLGTNVAGSRAAGSEHGLVVLGSGDQVYPAQSSVFLNKDTPHYVILHH